MSTLYFYLAFLVTFALSDLLPHQTFTTIDKHPYFVGVRNGKLKCAGVLLSSYYALTSLKCVQKKDRGNWQVQAGADYFDQNKNSDEDLMTDFDTPPEDPIKSDVDQIIPLEHDLALLLLKPLILVDSPVIQMANLPEKNLESGTNVTLLGWSRRGKILVSNLEIIGNCDLSASQRNNSICAGSKECNQDTDSAFHGDVLVKDGVVHGFLAAGTKCPGLKSPAIFSNVVATNDKILEIVK